MRELCIALPKVELHQHLTGSLPLDGVREVLATSRPDLVPHVSSVGEAPSHSVETLQDAWEQLSKQCDAVAEATASAEVLERLFAEAIASLAKDNIMYCELRIGLKAQPTKQEYLDLLVSVIRKQQKIFPSITVRLLLSIARHRDPTLGAENVDIAINHVRNEREPIVCGVELGGVASVGNWEAFQPLFQRAREAGLSVALHCGEDLSQQEQWEKMIAFKPDRLGHCVLLDGKNLDLVVTSRTPVETCLTCHKLHFGVPFEKNVFARLHPTQQVVLGTDNPSFYDTHLSLEYERCCCHHGLRVDQLFSLARRAIDFTFQSAGAKDEMKKDFDKRLAQVREKYNLHPAHRL